jgi:hypothetical protein
VADIGVEVKKANEGAWAFLPGKVLGDNLVGHVFEIELRRVGELYERGSRRFLCRRHLRDLDRLAPKEVKDLFQTINFFRPE